MIDLTNSASKAAFSFVRQNDRDKVFAVINFSAKPLAVTFKARKSKSETDSNVYHMRAKQPGRKKTAGAARSGFNRQSGWDVTASACAALLRLRQAVPD